MTDRYLLALDQGTTSTRAILFDADGAPRASAQVELPQIYPQPGWVEHDAEEIWRATVSVLKRTLANARVAATEIAAIGITNQRETTVLWDRATRQADPQRHRLAGPPHRRMVPAHGGKVGDDELGNRTGLLFDAYFSGSKIAWLLDNVAGARAAAEARQARLRHDRHVPAVAADRRQGARDRRDQRLAHHAVQPAHAGLGRDAAEGVRHPGRRSCPRCRTARPSSAPSRPTCWAPPSRSPASPATSRRRRSARPASRRG